MLRRTVLHYTGYFHGNKNTGDPARTFRGEREAVWKLIIMIAKVCELGIVVYQCQLRGENGSTFFTTSFLNFSINKRGKGKGEAAAPSEPPIT